MIKTCPQCNSEFRTYRKAAIYCSKLCQNQSQVKAKFYECCNCKSFFSRPNYRRRLNSVKVFCSHLCHLAYKANNARITTCQFCGIEFRNSNSAVTHCSWNCRNLDLVTSKDELCEGCGCKYRAFLSEIKRGRRFCSRYCYERTIVGPAHPNFVHGKSNKFGPNWNAVRLFILERDTVCRLCGKDKHCNGRNLDVHHITGRRHFILLEEANQYSNLVALCHSCHTKTEMAINHGRIDDLPIWLRPLA